MATVKPSFLLYVLMPFAPPSCSVYWGCMCTAHTFLCGSPGNGTIISNPFTPSTKLSTPAGLPSVALIVAPPSNAGQMLPCGLVTGTLLHAALVLPEVLGPYFKPHCALNQYHRLWAGEGPSRDDDNNNNELCFDSFFCACRRSCLSWGYNIVWQCARNAHAINTRRIVDPLTLYGSGGGIELIARTTVPPLQGVRPHKRPASVPCARCSQVIASFCCLHPPSIGKADPLTLANKRQHPMGRMDKRSHHLHICVFVSLCILGYNLWPQGSTAKHAMEYGLMLDAGSTGSRIHVYSFDAKSGKVVCGWTPLALGPWRVPRAPVRMVRARSAIEARLA